MTDTTQTTVIEDPAETDVTPAGRTVRWGALVWGLLVIAIAGYSLSIVASADARAGFVAWLAGLSSGGWIVVGVFVVGGLILLRGLVALLRQVQRSRR